MSNEVSVRTSLTIRTASGNIQYNSQPSGFQGSMPDSSYSLAGSRGPSPGVVLVQLNNTTILFPQLKQPGFCRIMNQDKTNFCIIGILATTGGIQEFYPLMDVGPLESYVIKLSRYLGFDLKPGTGTGTSPGLTSKLCAKADVAPVELLVEAFEA